MNKGINNINNIQPNAIKLTPIIPKRYEPNGVQIIPP